ncbi:hypothetical protein UCDDA912_g01961 [Diaporthe ampelina]|uniref:Uncharacterized protein n=1 Tax=Diaporthe ampelina TaxID=1214573 RepID=A0A0G2FVM1_9PEZI|nr:hypothetical protein UCDDA912_g01961 [Diaporthe ampelina]
MSDQEQLRQHQRALWNLICRNYPSDICNTLENTDHVHNDVLHYLYSILQGARGKGPAYFIAKLTSLPDTTAKEMTDALDALNIRGPDLAESASDGRPDKGKARGRPELESKPYFHSCERECFWLVVLELFKAGCLGRNTDGSAREEISDFDALHYLYRLDVEDKRCRRNEEVELRNPAHCWYHETSDKQVLWCVKRMWPLVEDKLKSKDG